MRISGDNPLCTRVLCFDDKGQLLSALAWVDLFTFEAKTLLGKDIEVAEVVIAHPTGRKFGTLPKGSDPSIKLDREGMKKLYGDG